jgi:hypothetical protein
MPQLQQKRRREGGVGGWAPGGTPPHCFQKTANRGVICWTPTPPRTHTHTHTPSPTMPVGGGPLLQEWTGTPSLSHTHVATTEVHDASRHVCVCVCACVSKRLTAAGGWSGVEVGGPSLPGGGDGEGEGLPWGGATVGEGLLAETSEYTATGTELSVVLPSPSCPLPLPPAKQRGAQAAMSPALDGPWPSHPGPGCEGGGRRGVGSSMCV